MNRNARFGKATYISGGVLIVALCAVSFGEYRGAAGRLEAAAGDLATCRQLAAEIGQLESLPAIAALEADSPGVTAGRIERAVKSARLPEAAVVRIQPQTAYRLGRSPYQVVPTRLELKQVTLRQIMDLSHGLSDAGKGLTVRDLRIWEANRGRNSGQETWSAEVTLTQLTFSPKTP